MQPCTQCDKTTDTFNLDYQELINPITGELTMIGDCVCLTCYMKEVMHLPVTKAHN